jgi:sterol desaturase/sphingolipid hydroxylase (fatty acid hydroxylase superfamily)
MAKKYVSNKDESARMFRSDFLEAFTHVHWTVPHMIFIPVILGMLFWSYRLGMPWDTAALMFGAGILIWTFAEYLVHRFAFHAAPEVEDEVRETLMALDTGQPSLAAIKGWRQKYYFIAHGVHHDFPHDSKRLVMPPSLSIPLAVAFFLLFRLIFGAMYAPAAFAGLVLGYLVYDTIHYAVHHFSLRGRILLYLKKHHYRHHYQNSRKDYGVSSPMWDLVFGTWNRKAVAPEGPQA